MFNKIKSIRHYFPDIPTAMHLIAEGKKKYAKHKKFVLTNEKITRARGRFVDAAGKTTLYIDPALAAIMYATGKEPKDHDLNTPSETYGWDFNETRDILNALDALSKGDQWYWNLFYGEEGTQRIISPIKSIAV
jgi:hypothetical protein